MNSFVFCFDLSISKFFNLILKLSIKKWQEIAQQKQVVEEQRKNFLNAFKKRKVKDEMGGLAAEKLFLPVTRRMEKNKFNYKHQITMLMMKFGIGMNFHLKKMKMRRKIQIIRFLRKIFPKIFLIQMMKFFREKNQEDNHDHQIYHDHQNIQHHHHHHLLHHHHHLFHHHLQEILTQQIWLLSIDF